MSNLIYDTHGIFSSISPSIVKNIIKNLPEPVDLDTEIDIDTFKNICFANKAYNELQTKPMVIY